jgi:hypothetical protein
MAEIRKIAEDDLERWVTTTRAALDEADTVEGYLDWKRQARETITSSELRPTSTNPRRSAHASEASPVR